MNDNAVGGGKCTPFSFNINGRKLTIIEIKGVLYFIAKEVGLFLDYSENGGRLATKITQVWSKPNKEGEVEMREGPHWMMLDGDLLTAVLSFVPSLASAGTDPVPADFAPTESVGAKIRHLLLLTEVGLNRVLLLTHKAAGRRLRDRLDSEILPQLHRTEMYIPEEKQKELEAALNQVEALKKELAASNIREAKDLLRRVEQIPAPQHHEPEVRMLRKLLDRYKASIPEHVWVALNAAMEGVEDIKGLVNCLEDFPVGRIKSRKDPAYTVLHQTIGTRVYELSVADMERVYAWTQTRPLWLTGEPTTLPAIAP